VTQALPIILARGLSRLSPIQRSPSRIHIGSESCGESVPSRPVPGGVTRNKTFRNLRAGPAAMNVAGNQYFLPKLEDEWKVHYFCFRVRPPRKPSDCFQRKGPRAKPVRCQGAGTIACRGGAPPLPGVGPLRTSDLGSFLAHLIASIGKLRSHFCIATPSTCQPAPA